MRLESPIHQIGQLVKACAGLKKLGNIQEGDPSHKEVVRLRLENRSAILGLFTYLGITLAGGGIGFAAAKIQGEMRHPIAPINALQDTVPECNPDNPSLIAKTPMNEFIEWIDRILLSSDAYTESQEGQEYAIRLHSFLLQNARIGGHRLPKTDTSNPHPAIQHKNFDIHPFEQSPDSWFKKHSISFFRGGTLYLTSPILNDGSMNNKPYRSAIAIKTAQWLIAINDAYHGSEIPPTDPLTDSRLGKAMPEITTQMFRESGLRFEHTVDALRANDFDNVCKSLMEFGKTVALSVVDNNARNGGYHYFLEASIYIYARILLSSGSMPGLNEHLRIIVANPDIIHNMIKQ